MFLEHDNNCDCDDNKEISTNLHRKRYCSTQVSWTSNGFDRKRKTRREKNTQSAEMSLIKMEFEETDSVDAWVLFHLFRYHLCEKIILNVEWKACGSSLLPTNKMLSNDQNRLLFIFKMVSGGYHQKAC